MILLNRSPIRPEIAQSAIVHLATFAALGLLGWVLAYWTWQWFAPTNVQRAPIATASDAKAESAKSLFGNEPRERAAAGSTIGLLGVIAATGDGSGYAIMRFADRAMRPVKEGEEIAPGIRLSEVHPDRVVLERGGVFETLALPGKKTPAEPVASPIKK